MITQEVEEEEEDTEGDASKNIYFSIQSPVKTVGGMIANLLIVQDKTGFEMVMR